jgi:hypothetical protein
MYAREKKWRKCLNTEIIYVFLVIEQLSEAFLIKK